MEGCKLLCRSLGLSALKPGAARPDLNSDLSTHHLSCLELNQYQIIIVVVVVIIIVVLLSYVYMYI